MVAVFLPDSGTWATTLGAVLGGLLCLYLATPRAPLVHPKTGAKLREIPIPEETLPVLGILLVYSKYKERIRDWTVAKCALYDFQPWIRRIPLQPELVTFSSPDAMEEITSTQFENFEKGQFQIDIIGSLFGRGVVASDGERWYHQRKAAVKFFSAKTLRAFMDKSMHKNLEQLCNVVEKAMVSGEQIELKSLFHEFTLQTFVETGLGVQLDWIGRKEPHPFQVAIESASPLILTRFRRPAFFWKLQRWLDVGVEGEFNKHMTVVYSWLHEVIQQGLTAAASKSKQQLADTDTKSVIERFVELSDEEKDGLRAEDMADFLLTFVVAARDTTATTLAWLFYAVGQHPQVEAKLRDELKEKLPDLFGRKDVVLGADHVKDLVYLEATIRETLRLYPAAPAVAKQVVRDTIVCGDVPLRKGQICVLHAFAMARNPHVWGPDAAEFNPERWIDPSTRQLVQVSPFKLFTFHAGPRACIGMKLALLELRSVTATLYNRYSFDVDPSNDGTTVVGPTLIMKDPLHAKVASA